MTIGSITSRPALWVRPLLLVGISLISMSCAPPEVGEGRFLVLDLDASNGRYALEERRIPTLDDVPNMQSTLVDLRSGGDLVATTEEPQSEAEWRDALVVESSETPPVDYEVQGDLVVPLDFHTTILFTLAHHIERADEYFDSIGLRDDEAVGKIPLFYRPALDTGLLPVPVPIFTDNAAYAFTLDAFIVPPRLLLNDLPLAANRGVIVHEYSHAVFNRVVHQDRRAPSYLTDDWPQIAVNEMLSLDEGVADIFGALQTNQPDFIEPSLSGDVTLDRDLEEERFYDDSLLQSVQIEDELNYNPYPLGSVVASALWSTRDVFSESEIGALVLVSLRQIADPDEDFRITDFLIAFVEATPADSRAIVCERFRERFFAVRDAIDCEAAR